MVHGLQSIIDVVIMSSQRCSSSGLVALYNPLNVKRNAIMCHGQSRRKPKYANKRHYRSTFILLLKRKGEKSRTEGPQWKMGGCVVGLGGYMSILLQLAKLRSEFVVN